MEITKAFETIKDIEKKIENAEWHIEYHKNYSKLYKHKYSVADKGDISYCRAMISLAEEHSQQFAEHRSQLIIEERNLRVAKLRLKKYFEEEL